MRKRLESCCRFSSAKNERKTLATNAVCSFLLFQMQYFGVVVVVLLVFCSSFEFFRFFSFEDCFFLNERKKCPTDVRWLRQLVMFADGNLLWQTCSGCFDRRVGIQPQHSAKTWLLGIGLCKEVEKCATWPCSGPIQEYAAQHQWDEGIDECINILHHH